VNTWQVIVYVIDNVHGARQTTAVRLGDGRPGMRVHGALQTPTHPPVDGPTERTPHPLRPLQAVSQISKGRPRGHGAFGAKACYIEFAHGGI